MAADVGWMSGQTSSVDITIFSFLFLAVYITVYTLCTTCFSEAPECPEEKEVSLCLSLSVNLEEQCRMNELMSNVDAKSDSYFSLQVMPRVPGTPAFSVRSTGSVSPVLPELPPVPPIFSSATVQMETPILSSSGQQPQTAQTVWDCVTPPPENQPYRNSGFTETVSEEHPYASIETRRVSGPSSPSCCVEADENRWESETPYHTVTEWTKPISTRDLATPLPVRDSEKRDELQFFPPPLPAVQDTQLLINTDITALYAAVNQKNKTKKFSKESALVIDNR